MCDDPEENKNYYIKKQKWKSDNKSHMMSNSKKKLNFSQTALYRMFGALRSNFDLCMFQCKLKATDE